MSLNEPEDENPTEEVNPEPIGHSYKSLDIRFVADEIFDRFEGDWSRQEIQERKDALVQQHQRFMENLRQNNYQLP